MTLPEPIRLTTDIADLPDVGERRAAAFRAMGLRCAADLLLHLPSRYERHLGERAIEVIERTVGERHGAAAVITASGEVATVRARRGRRPRVEGTLEDGTGTMLLTWFNAPWMRDRLHPGMRIRVSGRARRYDEHLQMVNPSWEVVREEEPPPATEERLRPVYPASEQVPSAHIERVIDAILEPALDRLDDHLHAEYREQRAIPALAEAYRLVHRPQDHDDVGHGRRRLAIDELLLLQLGVMMKRHHRRTALRAVPLPRTEAIDEHITTRLPFRLTDAQRAVIDEIATDVAREVPMNRLLQGDVGSGKTVVALYAMLLAVAAGRQAALMAPTELLAEQHEASLHELLGGSSVRIALLTGSLRPKARGELVAMIEAGEADLVIGTHALLTEAVAFRDLAVVVVDEQHRFGVHQRASLRSKQQASDVQPHMLVMTATPIPRTLSLTVFGDLDVSTIRALPPGRHPVITKHVGPEQAGEVYAFVAERVAAGEQAYVVVPVIDESDAGLVDLTSHAERLRAGPLRDARVEAVHGRLPREEREAVMSRFRGGDLDVLVATTVIEVGVDVPNATIMVVENADRFGLAQLHQLRGRVGRGSRRSVCVLTADPATDDGRARLEAMVTTDDGFRIAELDLEIRGPGELFGARQSGLAPFRVATFPRDLDLLRLARRDAEAWIEANPTLEGERDALLRKRLMKAHGSALGLGDVG